MSQTSSLGSREGEGGGEQSRGFLGQLREAVSQAAQATPVLPRTAPETENRGAMRYS